MPLPRYLVLIAIVLAAAGATVLLAALIAPALPEAVSAWVGIAVLGAAALAFFAARGRR